MGRIFNILMIEDDAADVLYYKEMFANAHNYYFMITDVPRMRMAKDIIRVAAFDAILLDLNLVDSRGMETIASIGELSEASGIPIIVLSSSDSHEIARRAILAGAVDYLIKGQDDAALVANIIHYTIARYQRTRTAVCQ